MGFRRELLGVLLSERRNKLPESFRIFHVCRNRRGPEWLVVPSKSVRPFFPAWQALRVRSRCRSLAGQRLWLGLRGGRGGLEEAAGLVEREGLGHRVCVGMAAERADKGDPAAAALRMCVSVDDLDAAVGQAARGIRLAELGLGLGDGRDAGLERADDLGIHFRARAGTAGDQGGGEYGERLVCHWVSLRA